MNVSCLHAAQTVRTPTRPLRIEQPASTYRAHADRRPTGASERWRRITEGISSRSIHSGPRSADSAAPNKPLRPPPDADLQPLTEGQFAAVVQGFRVTEAPGGTRVYTRDGYPWKFIRVGSRVKVEHSFYGLPAGYYTIISC